MARRALLGLDRSSVSGPVAPAQRRTLTGRLSRVLVHDAGSHGDLVSG